MLFGGGNEGICTAFSGGTRERGRTMKIERDILRTFLTDKGVVICVDRQQRVPYILV